MSLSEELRKKDTTIHQLKEFNRMFVETGTVTVILSLFETYLKVYENRLWAFASNLQWNLLRTEDDAYLKAITDEQLMMKKYTREDGQEYNISEEFLECVEAVQFLRSIRGRSSKERKNSLMERIAYDPYVEKVIELPNCSRVSEDAVAEELKGVYLKLSDVVHQVGSKFCGDNDFQLPRAGRTVTIPHIYAYATIVKACGFTPIYPGIEHEALS